MVLEHARDARFPKGTDVFMMKFQGLFFVAPAQNSFMCRLRIPGGVLHSYQFRGLADAGRDAAPAGTPTAPPAANLQFREIGPARPSTCCWAWPTWAWSSAAAGRTTSAT